MHCKVKDNTATRSGRIYDILAEVLCLQVNDGKTLSSFKKKKLEIVTKGLSLFITGAVGIYLDLLIGSFAHQYNRIFTKITHTHTKDFRFTPKLGNSASD